MVGCGDGGGLGSGAGAARDVGGRLRRFGSLDGGPGVGLQQLLEDVAQVGAALGAQVRGQRLDGGGAAAGDLGRFGGEQRSQVGVRDAPAQGVVQDLPVAGIEAAERLGDLLTFDHVGRS